MGLIIAVVLLGIAAFALSMAIVGYLVASRMELDGARALGQGLLFAPFPFLSSGPLLSLLPGLWSIVGLIFSSLGLGAALFNLGLQLGIRKRLNQEIANLRNNNPYADHR
jgi:hypothetical protein